MKFNQLTFLEKTNEFSKDKHLYSLWKCNCGNTKKIIHSRVVNGYTKSCGCLLKKNKTRLTHGKKYSSEYSSWQSAKWRCLNKNSKDWKRYGGAGINMHKDWVDSFENFYKHMGDKPKGTTLDRIDRNGNYEPGNCRWATVRDQQINRSGTFDWFIQGNHYLSAIEAANFHNVTIQTIRRWVLGFYDARRKTHTPPKENCYRIERYKK